MPNNRRKLGNSGKSTTIRNIQNAVYNALARPIHGIFGNPGNTGGYGGGRYQGAGVQGNWNPEYYYNEIYPADTLLTPVTQTFNQAFAEARRKGLNTFEFNGGLYGTQLGDNPNWRQAGDARTRETIVPVPIDADTIRHRSNVPREDIIHTRRYLEDGGTIYIKPSKRGTFTAAATKHGMSVQGFANKVLANKDNYSAAMVKKANFAKNFAK